MRQLSKSELLCQVRTLRWSYMLLLQLIWTTAMQYCTAILGLARLPSHAWSWFKMQLINFQLDQNVGAHFSHYCLQPLAPDTSENWFYVSKIVYLEISKWSCSICSFWQLPTMSVLKAKLKHRGYRLFLQLWLPSYFRTL